MRKTAILWTLGIVAGLTGAGILMFKNGTPLPEQDEVEPEEVILERLALNAAAAHITAESRDGFVTPAAQAAPRPEDAAPVDVTAPAPSPVPPDGYTFVAVQGQMNKARLEPAPSEPSATEGPSLFWLDAPDAMDALSRQADAAGRDWSFGWVRLAADATPADLRRALERQGVDVAGTAGNLFRARLPGDQARLRAIAALPEVDGLGAPPLAAKLPPAFARRALGEPPHEQAPVFVTLMANDPDGVFRRALENQGVTVGHFDPSIRVYTANIPYGALDAIAALDFVLAIEPIGVVQATHDSAVPAMGADALRTYSGTPGLFSGIGGASTPIGVMDTGLNINHLDIVSNRKSICGANFVWRDARAQDQDLWVDDGLHGTHVTGTIAGNGTAEPGYAGMAPSVEHIRFAKVLHSKGSGASDGVMRGMDFLAQASGCPEGGWSEDRVKPLIVNMSLSSSRNYYEGRHTGERKLDAIVWAHRQLFVVAQSNSDTHGFSNYGTAKNALSVGAAMDDGHIAAFSSHGPTADGRLAPQIVATGVDLMSALGEGSRGAYISFSGTSMASPATAGVAALLMDAVPEHREQPALTRARLMASAIKPTPWLDNPEAFPADNSKGPGTLQAQYGLGKVSARTSVLNRNQEDGWVSGGAISELADGEYAYQEIIVPPDTSRLDLVMTWDEPPTDTIASTVLNDLNLWLDRDGDCGAGACGEYSSLSRKDNVEWIIVRDPPPGTYRAKVTARRIYTAAPKAALAWTLIRGSSTPALSIGAEQDVVEGGGSQELTLTLTADAYVATGVQLYVDCRAATGFSDCWNLSIKPSGSTREDGVPFVANDSFGDSPGEYRGKAIQLGEIAAGETQEVKLQIGNLDGDVDATRLYFKASAWNAKAAFTSVEIRPGVGNLSDIPQVESPVNDDLANATVIEGESGSMDLDLVLSTPEPGEPPFSPRAGGAHGSVWYTWTAPGTDLFRLGVSGSATGNVNIDVYTDDPGDPIVSRPWNAEFFAEAGQTYRIRVSHRGRTAPTRLYWSSGPRPANDDFQAAQVVEGTEGAVEGDNQGATLERGESFGPLAATTWYRWTAPSDGTWRWRFESNVTLRVFAFSGDSLSNLRLVSGRPGTSATFAARQGEEYYIVVAAWSAFAGGSAYKLTWRDTERDPGNDDFQGAQELESASSSSEVVVSWRSTVEPGEPPESGIQTSWWTWTAPEDGRYVWRLTDTLYTEMLVTVFSGDTLENLRVVATTGPNVPSTEFALKAEAGQRYWISVGWSADDLAAFTWWTEHATLRWGLAPQNDDLANAASLKGAQGSASGSNQFASAEPGERTHSIGHSSLWWTFEAPAPGWYRFWADADSSPALTAYRQHESGDVELIRTSNSDSRLVEVLFEVKAGERLAIRLGTRGGDQGGDFTLHWEEADAPIWLRYAGRLADDNSVELQQPSGLALNSRGTALYVASELGLQVFERDPESDSLTIRQSLPDDQLADNALFWSPNRGTLYAAGCGVREFSPVDDTQLTLEEDSAFSSDGAYCTGDVFTDSSESFVYRASPSQGIETFAFETSALRLVQTTEIDALRGALLSNDDRHFYVITDDSLLVFQRSATTGQLTEPERMVSVTDAEAIAISGDDRYLFVLENGERTSIYNLDDPANPSHLQTLEQFDWNRSWGREMNVCAFASPRLGIPAIDAFCNSKAFSVRWHPQDGDLVETDNVAHPSVDRFNNYVHDFGTPRALAPSPDGKHIYLATEEGGIAIFERVGNQLVDPNAPQEGGFLPLDQLSVSFGKVGFGPLSSSTCIGLAGAEIAGANYSVRSSKWQQRAPGASVWTDVAGTEATGGVCAQTPSGPGDYRLVAEITIDGKTGNYTSNLISGAK